MLTLRTYVAITIGKNRLFKLATRVADGGAILCIMKATAKQGPPPSLKYKRVIVIAHG